MMTETNKDQIAYWNGDVAGRWLFNPNKRLDRCGVVRPAWAAGPVRVRRATGRIFNPTDGQV
jgi:hypothetical protein